MTTKKQKKYRSPIAEAMHETASGLRHIGIIDAKTMREFDASCLTTIEPLTGEQILALRERAGVSSGGIRAGVECTTESGQRMGTRGEEAEWNGFKASLYREGSRAWRDYLMGSSWTSSARRMVGARPTSGSKRQARIGHIFCNT